MERILVKNGSESLVFTKKMNGNYEVFGEPMETRVRFMNLVKKAVKVMESKGANCNGSVFYAEITDDSMDQSRIEVSKLPNGTIRLVDTCDGAESFVK